MLLTSPLIHDRRGITLSGEEQFGLKKTEPEERRGVTKRKNKKNWQMTVKINLSNDIHSRKQTSLKAHGEKYARTNPINPSNGGKKKNTG